MSRIANRYSKALFQLAQNQNKIDPVYQDMQFIANLISRSHELKSMLENPLIQSRIKGDVFSKIFKAKVDPLTYNFLSFICDKRRTNLLPSMIYRFEEYVHDYKEIITAKVVSAQSLDEEQIQKIKNNLVDKIGKTVLLKQAVNNELIGGFIIRIKDTIIDLSVKGQLEKLRERMVLG